MIRFRPPPPPASSPPPHDLDAERAVIGAVLLRQVIDDAAARVSRHHFYREVHQRVWRVLQDLQRDHGRVDVVTAQAALRADKHITDEDRTAAIHALATVPSDAGLDQYVERVLNLARAREILQAARRISTRLRDAGTWDDPDALLGEELQALREGASTPSAADPVASLADLFAKDLPERTWLVPGLLPESKILTLFGASYTGKSLLAYHLALCLARGDGEFLGHAVGLRPRKVLLLMGENDELELRDACREILAGAPPPANLVYIDVLLLPKRVSLSTNEGQAWLRRMVIEHRVDVIVPDNNSSLCSNIIDEEATRLTMNGFKHLGKELGTTTILVAHTRKKGPKDRDIDEVHLLYGSHLWGTLADSLVYVDFDTDSTSDRRLVKVKKVRGIKGASTSIFGIDPASLQFRRVENVATPRARSRGQRRPRTNPVDVLNLLSETPLSRKDIQSALLIGARKLRYLLNSPEWKGWIQDGTIEVVEVDQLKYPLSFRLGESTSPEITCGED